MMDSHASKLETEHFAHVESAELPVRDILERLDVPIQTFDPGPATDVQQGTFTVTCAKTVTWRRPRWAQ